MLLFLCVVKLNELYARSSLSACSPCSVLGADSCSSAQGPALTRAKFRQKRHSSRSKSWGAKLKLFHSILSSNQVSGSHVCFCAGKKKCKTDTKKKSKMVLWPLRGTLQYLSTANQQSRHLFHRLSVAITAAHSTSVKLTVALKDRRIVALRAQNTGRR
jgi:hypothetical protein